MMILSIKVLFVLGLFGFACALKKYVFSLLVLFGAMALEVFENGLTNSWLLVGCEIVFIVLIVKETSLRKDKSILVKYNGSSCMTVGGFPPHKFAWPLFYGLLSRSSGPRNFD